MAKQKYSADEIEAIARDAMANALGSPESDVGRARLRNIEYYNATATGDLAPPEIADRSDFVATDVADTIEWMLPSFMDMFVSDDKAVEFEGKNPESEAQAKLATNYVNHLFYTKNDGLAILYDWFKDASLQKVGFVKVWVEEQSDDAKQDYEGQSEEQLVMLMQDGWQLKEEPQVDENQGLVFTVYKESRSKQIRISTIAPHEMRVDGNARWDSEPAMIGQEFYKRRFELEQEGYIVDDLSGDNGDLASSEALAMLGDSFGASSTSPHRSHDLIKVEEVYIKLDQDDDGIAEWLKICLLDGKLAIHEDDSDAWEMVDGHPYVWICPVPRPHAFFGDCPADFAIQPQKMRTETIRTIHDNMFLTTNNRTYVNTEAGVNLEDAMESRPGGIIRGKAPANEAIQQLVTPNLGAPAYQFNEYLETWKENRTGFTRYSQGTDSNSLNKTATGVSIITQKADMRIKLMARFYAVGVKNLFAKVLKLAITYQNQTEMVLINGEFVPINPSLFRNDFNMKINVGLGTGSKDQQVGRMMGMMQQMLPGVQMGVVTPENYGNALMELYKANEIKAPERFVTLGQQPPQGMPQEQVQQMQQQAEQQMGQMNQEIQRLSEENSQLKLANQNKMADTQIKGQTAEVDAQAKAKELELKEREIMLKERAQMLDEQEAQAKIAIDTFMAETARLQALNTPETAQNEPQEREPKESNGAMELAIAGLTQVLANSQAPKQSVGSMTRLPDGSYQMVKQENI